MFWMEFDQGSGFRACGIIALYPAKVEWHWPERKKTLITGPGLRCASEAR